MNPTTPAEVTTPKTREQQIADIKSQAAQIVTQAKKIDPNIKVSVANAEMIGAPKLAVPTTPKIKQKDSAIDNVGTTPITPTGTDKAREALLSQVPEEDRDTISAILDASMGLQTERGSALETELETLSADRLDLAQRKKDRTKEGLSLQGEQKIPELEAELESIRSEADVLDARKNSAVQAEAGRSGMSTTAQQNNINAIEKDFNLQKANLAIRELASVGKINAATKLIESKLDIKYGDIEAETELVKAQIEAILPLLSREDAKVAQTRLLLNEQVSATIAEARAEDKALEEFKLQSYINAQQNGATPAVLSAIMSSENRGDVANVGGTFIQSPMEKLQMAQIRSSIETNNLQQQKLRQEIQETEDAGKNAELVQTLISNADPVSTKDALSSLLGSKAISPATKTRISPALAVLNAVDELANSNIEGKFTGVGLFGRMKEGVKGLFNMKAPEAINNAQNIEAINLKVQQWASGASLTEQQTEQVNKLTPKLNDSDKTVKQKMNGLYNFMLNQTESDLMTDGVNVQFPSINLFEIADLYEKASPEQKRLIDAQYFGKTTENTNRSW